VPDGEKLYTALQPVLGDRLPAAPTVATTDVPLVLGAARHWLDWCESVFSEPADGLSAWRSERMEYAFDVAAHSGAGEVVLSAPDYADGDLDWLAFSGTPPDLAHPALPSPVEPLVREGIPSPITFPGMPAARWWEMEDGRVDVGAVRAGPTDVLRLVFIEFATVYGNDWFQLPLDAIPVGSICRLPASSLVVTDTFGVDVPSSPFSTADWRMFQVTGADPELLLLPPVVAQGLEGRPLEDVELLRDELANMAWGVERTVESDGGRPLDLHSAEAAAHPSMSGPPAADASAAYRIQTGVPETWHPLVLEVVSGSRRLVRKSMPRYAVGAPASSIVPRGQLLAPPEMWLHDEELTRSGARVTRAWQYARWVDGSTHVWIGRRKGPGRGQGSSGLRFDSADREPSS